MKKKITNLEKHLENHPTDANGVISLLKARSYNFEYDYNLEKKRKREKMNGFERKEKKYGGN